MALEKVSTILKNAEKKGMGVLSYNAFNLESISWLIETAEEQDQPVIIMLYPAIHNYISFSTFAAVTRSIAEAAKTPVGLHLDHSNSYTEILHGIKCGFTSVMIDGSSLPYEENVAVSAEVAKAAHAMGVDVEAELGHVGTASVRSDFLKRDNFTQPEKAVEFLSRTGVDSLAVAIGSAHGNYVETPNLDFDLLDQIKKIVTVPLALHGGSGIPDDQIRKAIRHGINKVNIGTEYNQIYYETISRAVAEGTVQHKNMMGIMSAVKPAVKAYIVHKMDLMKG